MNQNKKITDAIFGYSDDPFFKAIWRLDLSAVQAFTKSGFSPDYVYKDKSALEYAVHCIGSPPNLQEIGESILSHLVERGGQIEAIQSELKLKLAILNQNDAKVQHLLRESLDLSYIDGKGQTLLMLATKNSNDRIMRMLINAGAEVNQLGLDNVTALLYAVMLGEKETVKYLLTQGANPNLDYRGDKPSSILTAAKRKRDPELISMLKAAGAIEQSS